MANIRLTLNNKSLTELPVQDPDWLKTTIINLSDNKFSVLNASLIPKTTYSLNLSDCSIESIVGHFPESLKILSLDFNKLTILDTKYLPSGLIYLSITNNHIKEIEGRFKEGLNELFLDNNNLSVIPHIPDTLTTLGIQNNPVANERMISKNLNKANIQKLLKPSATILWQSSTKNVEIFSDDDITDVVLLPPNDFTEFKKNLYEDIKSLNLCKSQIEPDYIERTLAKPNIQIITSIFDEVVTGVALFFIKDVKKKDNNNEGKLLHIDILCSSKQGIGSLIFDRILAYVKNHKEIRTVRLDSVYGAIGFYEKKGFVVKCHENSLCPMNYSRRGGKRSGGKRSGGKRSDGKRHGGIHRQTLRL